MFNSLNKFKVKTKSNNYLVITIIGMIAILLTVAFYLGVVTLVAWVLQTVFNVVVPAYAISFQQSCGIIVMLWIVSLFFQRK